MESFIPPFIHFQRLAEMQGRGLVAACLVLISQSTTAMRVAPRSCLAPRTTSTAMKLKTPRAVKAPASGSLSSKIRSAGFTQEKDGEISDSETAFRWIAVQATVDLSIVAGFAYHMQSQWGSFDWNRAVAEPELKFLIIMPALSTFMQILRRFGSEELPNRYQAFEDDPIVKYLGGADKVRSIRERWKEAWTIKQA